MIIFLTLLYVGVLAVLVKIKLVPLNTFWKLSPVLWMLLLLVVLFIPMQWGAPAGSVATYQDVVEIIPNVSGEVVEVPVRALQPLEQGDVLFRIDPKPFEDKIADLEASLNLARVNLKRGKELFSKKVGPEADVDRFAAEVDSNTARLAQAQWELEQTVVRAPSPGYVTRVTLRPGQRVANLPLRSWMAFVNAGDSRLTIGINQNQTRHVRLGQDAEVTLKILPGRTLAAKVIAALPLTPQGQLAPSGEIPLAPNPQTVAQPYGVLLELVDPGSISSETMQAIALGRVPGGAVGTGAIYTESAQATHLIRRVMVRMQAWMNYLMPY
jgi:multidrug efflux pump subunit AcrA (membrane-fusion protein)